MYQHETKIRVRYSETDQMGYVYNGNYAQYYEVGRVEMMRSLGMSYGKMEESGIMLPLLELKCKFIKPGLYDQELTIRTSVKTLPGIRMTFDYEIYNEEQELINIGSTILVFFDMEKKRPCPPPDYFIERIQEYFA
ncbi:acyl-CoA thioesterase [Pedobacter antarcticus]|jgi:acyl-CoA thioester hydrolase|uniref:Thioesterase n=2 Tax=Pedobacter antarcticus TaxID=34086 RepID=A0A081PKW8_9SPHI|nr:thioesterase family protein [Pedobacter antarcticus]KEQ31341.1 thioesterase [Pedobacter antarcticus 4BY]SDL47402.1 acyl-CoA thioester hydrolase [Pedobacter antarcticus]SFE37529.1 acyl-CoA thioester hydrolase [Pedobacter antarcticus]